MTIDPDWDSNDLFDRLSEVAWQFNEAVSLLREARRIYVPDETTLAAEIDEALPRIQVALENAASAA